MKSNVLNIEISKNPIKPGNLPQLVVTSGISTYQNKSIDQTDNPQKTTTDRILELPTDRHFLDLHEPSPNEQEYPNGRVPNTKIGRSRLPQLIIDDILDPFRAIQMAQDPIQGIEQPKIFKRDMNEFPVDDFLIYGVKES